MWKTVVTGSPALFLAGCLIPALLILLFILAQVGLVTLAFTKLGLAPWQGFLLLAACLLGGRVNLPLFSTGRLVRSRPRGQAWLPGPGGVEVLSDGPAELVRQVVAVNLGGCVIPCLMSVWLLAQTGFAVWMGLCLALTTAVAYGLARPRPGGGMAVPVLVPPLAAVLAAVLLAPDPFKAHAAYVAGSLGTLLGGDVLYLLDRRQGGRMDIPRVCLGGEGTFTGIFLAGVIAALLA